MKNLHFEIDKTTKRLGIRDTPHGVLRITGRAADATKLYLDALKNPDKRVTSETTSNHFADDNAGWRGSLETATQLFENKATPPKTSRDFKINKIMGETGSATRRKRVNSDLDGDWEYDRRHLDQPFTQMRKEKCDQTVWVEVDFCFSANVEKSKLDAYGDFVFQIIQAVEQRGFQCGVRLVARTTNLTECGLGGDVVLTIKEPGEYADRRFFRFFTTPFFRRAIFYLEIVAAKAVGTQTQYGLGTPSNAPRATAEKGLIKLTPGSLPQGEFMGDVINLIKTALAA